MSVSIKRFKMLRRNKRTSNLCEWRPWLRGRRGCATDYRLSTAVCMHGLLTWRPSECAPARCSSRRGWRTGAHGLAMRGRTCGRGDEQTGGVMTLYSRWRTTVQHCRVGMEATHKSLVAMARKASFSRSRAFIFSIRSNSFVTLEPAALCRPTTHQWVPHATTGELSACCNCCVRHHLPALASGAHSPP